MKSTIVFFQAAAFVAWTANPPQKPFQKCLCLLVPDLHPCSKAHANAYSPTQCSRAQPPGVHRLIHHQLIHTIEPLLCTVVRLLHGHLVLE